MSPLLFIIRRSIANIVKGLAKKPALLVLYILIAFASVGLIVLVFVKPATLMRGEPALFQSIMTALTIAVYYFSIRQGIEKGGSFFRSSDVSLVFPGPFRPNNVLLYGFIRQLGGMLLAMLVAFYQIPNLINNFELQPYGVWIIMLSVALYALSYPIFGMIVYAFTSKSKARKRFATALLNIAVLAVLLVLLYRLYETRDIVQAMIAAFGDDSLFFVPVIGWMRGIVSAAIGGVGWQFIVGLGLMASLIAAFLAILYRLNLDYYEEVLEATEYKEAALAAKKEGRNLQFGVKARRRVRQGLVGRGAAALFGKNMLELRKASFVMFFDRTSAIVIIAAIAFHFMMPKMLGYRMVMVLGFSVYMLFLMQMQGRWPVELGRHFIFTLPARPSSKLFWATASDHIKNLIDGTALFIITGALFQSSAAVILACVLCYAFLGAVFVYTDVLARRLFGGIHSKPLLIFVKLFFTIFIISPGIVAAIALSILTHSELLAVMGFALWALAAAAGAFAISSGIFKNIESGA